MTSLIGGTVCHKCGRHITESYGYDKEIRIRHLPIPGHKTFIRIRPERYECSCCEGKPANTQKMTWYDMRSPDTAAYERHVLPGLIDSTVADVGMKEDTGCEAVTGIISRHADGEADRNGIRYPGTTGTDGISSEKGRRDSVTLITGGEGRGGLRVCFMGVRKQR